ncbi:MAG: type II toxin-antitoxin system PemK/MazF family toxin [Candidatus Aenigmarchaeota archaeon]|nr:type II toxin-antitoxin system PemK/MazF family toxin [Candidatus Aenigmarchaeota archaeon]
MISQRDIVLLSFPFSDLKTQKIRPVIIISNDDYNQKFEDVIAIPMTSNLDVRDYVILISNKDLESGKLIKDSKAKIDRVFSVNKNLIKLKIGKIKLGVYKEIIEILLGLIEPKI